MVRLLEPLQSLWVASQKFCFMFKGRFLQKLSIIMKYFFWQMIFEPRTAQELLELKCIWHSYNSTVVKWKSYDSKLDNSMISKLSGNLHLNISKWLPKVDGFGLSLFKVMPTVPWLTPHPVFQLRGLAGL